MKVPEPNACGYGGPVVCVRRPDEKCTLAISKAGGGGLDRNIDS